MADFTMPALGADMETGKVVQWLVMPGDRVASGQVVAVIETHKGAIDVECFLDGVVESLVAVGSEWPVGAVLAQVRTDGQAAPAAAASTVPSAGSVASPSTARVSAATTATAATAPTSVAEPSAASPAAAPSATPHRAVTPAARRHALELGLDPEALTGTGPDGAVTLADVDAAASMASPTTRQSIHSPAIAAGAARAAPAGFDPAQMRQAIAAAMARSKREIPHYYLDHTIDFGAAAAWLEAYNRDRDPAERLLAAALLLKATALALVDVPQLNGFHEQGTFRAGAGIHIGWAISLRGGGLVAPAIHDADRQPLPALMGALRDLVQRARSARLRSSELTDPTITVTDLGERGVDSVHGVIVPPQVAIVGFGRVAPRPWVVDGRLVVRPLVSVTLAADHRASDGHLGGRLLLAIDRTLQQPGQL